MRFKINLLAAIAISLFLAGCGGGGATYPYDGAWSAVYPVADPSSIGSTQTVVCSDPPASLTLTEGVGSTTQNMTCVTTILATATTPAASFTQITSYKISVSIDDKGVVNAIVNGVTLTGTCISTVGCSATSSAGNTLSLTR